MKLELDGKRALITGSNVGIGKAIAKILASEGVAVVIHGLEEDKVTRVTQEIEKDCGKAFGIVGDLSTDEGAASVANQAKESLGSVDILINNTGAYENRGWMDATSKDWKAGATWEELHKVMELATAVSALKPMNKGGALLNELRKGELNGSA